MNQLQFAQFGIFTDLESTISDSLVKSFEIMNILSKRKYITQKVFKAFLRGELKMEFKKGSKGFTLEFNEEEERNFERFVNELKKNDEYSNLSSNSEFLALIINEGVATLQQKTSTKIDNNESDIFSDFSGILTEMLNETFSAILQHQKSSSTEKEGLPMNLDVLLNLMPDINSGNNKSVQPMEKDKYNSSIGETLTPSPEKSTEISQNKFD